MISESVRLPVRFPTGEEMNIDFFVTPLDPSCVVVLGYDWLTRYNPLIDWVKADITFRPTNPTSVASPGTPALKANIPSAPPSISLVNAAAFMKASKLEGSVMYKIQLSDLPDSLSARSAQIGSPPDLSNVPSEYHEFTDVFSKAKADKLAEH